MPSKTNESTICRTTDRNFVNGVEEADEDEGLGEYCSGAVAQAWNALTSSTVVVGPQLNDNYRCEKSPQLI